MEGKTEFIVFCIENIAAKLGVSAGKVFKALCEDSQIIYTYVIPNYDVLHTQSKDYIVNDIIDVMKEDGVQI